MQLTFTAARYNGEVVNTAAVLGAVDEYGDPAPDAQAAATVRIKLKAKLTVLKTGKDISGWPPVPGHVVDWKIRVGNAGQATLTNVVVTDTVARWQRLPARLHTGARWRRRRGPAPALDDRRACRPATPSC